MVGIEVGVGLSQAQTPGAFDGGGYLQHLDPSATGPAPQRLAPEAELASRAYARLACELPGSLGRQAAALSAFYGNLARATQGVAR